MAASGIDTTVTPQATLWADYIYLDTDERRRSIRTARAGLKRTPLVNSTRIGKTSRCGDTLKPGLPLSLRRETASMVITAGIGISALVLHRTSHRLNGGRFFTRKKLKLQSDLGEIPQDTSLRRYLTSI